MEVGVRKAGTKISVRHSEGGHIFRALRLVMTGRIKAILSPIVYFKSTQDSGIYQDAD